MSDGRCLKHAFSLMGELDQKGVNAVYVQGTVTSLQGKSFKHAWVELPKDRLIIDPTIDLKMDISKYYKTFQVRDVIRVDPFTAVMLCARGGFRFFTKQEVKDAEAHVRELDAKMAAKRKRKPNA